MLISPVTPQGVDAVVPDLAAVLLDCVADGASIGFLADLDQAGAQRWWRGALVGDGVHTWTARPAADAPVVGCVQLRCVGYPNGSHRADVAKLLVHRAARGRGVGSALMAALEAHAVRLGRWLLVLDTEQGSHAELLYQRWGWEQFGVLADHAAVPSGALRPTAYYAKRLART